MPGTTPKQLLRTCTCMHAIGRHMAGPCAYEHPTKGPCKCQKFSPKTKQAATLAGKIAAKGIYP